MKPLYILTEMLETVTLLYWTSRCLVLVCLGESVGCGPQCSEGFLGARHQPNRGMGVYSLPDRAQQAIREEERISSLECLLRLPRDHVLAIYFTVYEFPPKLQKQAEILFHLPYTTPAKMSCLRLFS